LPQFYSAQKTLFTQVWKAAIINTALTEINLKKTVEEVFYYYLYVDTKKKMLENLDSLYNNVLQKANLRLQKGEINIIEKVAIETQKNNIDVQLLQLDNEINVAQHQFQLLLHTHIIYTPQATNFKVELNPIIDSNTINKHPILLQLAQQTIIAKATTDIEKNKLLPDLLLGYSNASIRGMGADEKLYKSIDRFHTIQAGIGIPIFTKATKAKINASKLNEKIVENNYQIENDIVKNNVQTLYNQYQKNKQIVDLYEQQYLQNASLIIATAAKQFSLGEINYLDFVTLTNQAIFIKNNYIDAVKTLNENAIQFNYFISK
jgi:heavy metal efflux system protein